MIERVIQVFLDSGCHKKFYALMKDPKFGYNKLTDVNMPDSLKNALNDIKEIEDKGGLSESDRTELENIFKSLKDKRNKNNIKWRQTDYTFLRYRFGEKTWHFDHGVKTTLSGIWFAFETNTGAQDGNVGPEKYDRGYFYQTRSLTEEEIDMFNSELRENERKKINGVKVEDNKITGGESQYISRNESRLDVRYPIEITHNGKTFDFPNLNFSYEVLDPNGEVCDVDVILDVGNTRTAGLLFNHEQNADNFPPSAFRMFFKILRLKPDPFSGEYDSVRDVGMGIAPSWIVLHELEHETYWPPNPNRRPPDVPLLQKEYFIELPSKSNGFFDKLKDVVWKKEKFPRIKGGKVCLRVPQMFTQLSPVLIGDQAERYFETAYCKKLIQKGARVQQSSPKRYYWDTICVKNRFWNMLLNEWDQHYNMTFQLPKIQGEMFRFFQENGKILDLAQYDESNLPSSQPDPHPRKPIFPRQSTLTWMLLHILERAYAQANTSFSRGAELIPHRLSKVLITYPSGWTNDEVKLYQERCDEAVAIFNQSHFYANLREMDPNTQESRQVKVELVKEHTPDEAVAGQLPFIFSEIIRYPGMSAAKWISLAGKKRKDANGEEKATVRVMNFDIGGGTTDISIIEYKDLNTQRRVNQNILSTTLLFKDGKPLAGDDILKDIIEGIILKGIVNNCTDPEIKRRIIRYFSVAMNDLADEYTRSRIVRTCLIPLATMCLSASKTRDIEISAQNAGINLNNWNEFSSVIMAWRENAPNAMPGPAQFEDDVVEEEGVAEGEDAADAGGQQELQDNEEQLQSEPIIPYNQTIARCGVDDLKSIAEPLLKVLFQNCAIYAAAYDIDLLIFSGKPSELPVVKDLAKQFIPIDNGRIIFAREFKPGDWYPFTDGDGLIEDAKTVTVVGAALYFALSSGKIENWRIREEQINHVERNEWAQMQVAGDIEPILSKTETEATVVIMPNFIIGRRQNAISSQEPVYKFVRKPNATGPNDLVKVTFKREEKDNIESLVIKSIEGEGDVYDPEKSKYELVLWPCTEVDGFSFWQETGKFSGLTRYLAQEIEDLQNNQEAQGQY